MRVDSVEQLKMAFARWRRQKKHTREAIPAELMERARRGIEVHGWGPVRRATRIEARCVGLGKKKVGGGNTHASAEMKRPAYSRMELSAPAAVSQPFAEVVTGSGLRIRLFSGCAETVALLSSVCGLGVGR
jgi:hypothetical protein